MCEKGFLDWDYIYPETKAMDGQIGPHETKVDLYSKGNIMRKPKKWSD